MNKEWCQNRRREEGEVAESEAGPATMTSRASREGVDMVNACVGSEGSRRMGEWEVISKEGEVVRRDLPQ